MNVFRGVCAVVRLHYYCACTLRCPVTPRARAEGELCKLIQKWSPLQKLFSQIVTHLDVRLLLFFHIC